MASRHLSNVGFLLKNTEIPAGTPVQNNMRELFGVMNLLNPREWSDETDFFERYGGDTEVSTVEQIQALQVAFNSPPHLVSCWQASDGRPADISHGSM